MHAALMLFLRCVLTSAFIICIYRSISIPTINDSRTNHCRQRIQEPGSDYKQRWRIVNELLHSKDSDITRTDAENRRLCSTFAHYFVDKIVKLRDSVSETLHSLSVSVPSDLSFPSHSGSVLETLSPNCLFVLLLVPHGLHYVSHLLGLGGF